MGIEVETLTELDSDTVQQSQEKLSQLMGELDPTIDTRRGVLHDLLFHHSAIYAAKSDEEVARLQRSQSLQLAAQDPDLAEDDILDAVASNFRVTRKEGGQATGSVTIVLSQKTPLSIASGTIWEANGLQYTNETVFAAVLSQANVTSSTDRVLTLLNDGNYGFTIEVTAVLAGEDGQVRKGTLFVPQVLPVSFVKAYAASDFTSGADTETNAALIGRLLEGVACKALSGSTSMKAALIEQTAFENIIGSSIIGFGDGEMLRDQHSIFPGSTGGRVDWYIRTQELPQKVTVSKTATLVEKTDDGKGIWQFGVGRDDLPGFYDVFSVLPDDEENGTSFDIVSDSRSMDMTELDNDGFLPDIEDAVEGVYSRFQAAVIQFKDTITDATTLTENVSTADYSVTLRGMPLLAAIQDWVSDRSVRNKAGDVLIKAPVPCFLEISFTISLRPNQDEPDTEEIANNIATLVNRYGFTGMLPASAISDIIHDSLPAGAHTSAVDILGDIRRPDGMIRRQRTKETFFVPDEKANMTSSRTVAFIVDPQDIAISVETADIPET